jgi:hypothetical protein
VAIYFMHEEIMKALDLARPDAADGQVTGPSL